MIDLPNPGQLLFGITATDIICVTPSTVADKFHVLVPDAPAGAEPALSRPETEALIASSVYQGAEWRYCDCAHGSDPDERALSIARAVRDIVESITTPK